MYRTSASKSRPSRGCAYTRLWTEKPLRLHDSSRSIRSWLSSPWPRSSPHLVPEQLLGGSLVYVRHRDPLPGTRPSPLRRPLGSARWAQPSPLAGEGHQELLRALAALHTSEAVVPDTAVEIACHSPIRETAPIAILPLEPLLPHRLDPLVERVEKSPQGRLPGIPRPVDATGALHVPPEAGERDTGSPRRRTIRLRGPSLDRWGARRGPKAGAGRSSSAL